MDEHRLDSLSELLGILRTHGATFFEGHGIKVILEATVAGTGLTGAIVEEGPQLSPEERKLRQLFDNVPGGVPEFTRPGD